MSSVESNIATLIEVFKKLKQNGDKYENELADNELLTRYILIDPMLRALGWDTEKP